jgi:hypothetical protein
MLYNALVGKMDDRKTNNYIFGDPVWEWWEGGNGKEFMRYEKKFIFFVDVSVLFHIIFYEET